MNLRNQTGLVALFFGLSFPVSTSLWAESQPSCGLTSEQIDEVSERGIFDSELCVLMPKGIQIKPPHPKSPDYCNRFLGKWSGRWGNVQPGFLAVLSVDPRDDGSCNATIVYSVGKNDNRPYDRQTNTTVFAKRKAVISAGGETLKPRGKIFGGVVEFTMRGKNLIGDGTWDSNKGSVEMRKEDPDS